MIKLPRQLSNFALAALSGCLMVLIFPDWEISWLAPFALTPLIVSLFREPRPARRFLLGYFAGNVYWFGLCPWIQFVLEAHGGMGRWGGWATFLLVCLIKSIHLGVFALLAAIVLRRPYALPAIAAIWTVVERTYGELGFAWLCLGNAGIDMSVPLRLAPWTAVYGISFFFAIVATSAALVLVRQPRNRLYWLAAVPMLILLPPLPFPENGTDTAVMVQPNVPEEQEWSPELAERLHSTLLYESENAATGVHPRLIVWPEIPGPIYYFRDPALQNQIKDLALRTHAYILTGTVADTKNREPLNSTVLISPQGRLLDRYDKINLVPFGEYVPPAFNWVNRISHETGDFTPGDRIVVSSVGAEKLGAFICYESAFPDQVRRFVIAGATILANVSNDGYFGQSAARMQHLSLVRMRAVENHRWILRDTNDGVTASIDPAGRVIERLPAYRQGSGIFHFSPVSHVTAYSRYGDWFVWLCAIGASVALCASQIPRYHGIRR